MLIRPAAPRDLEDWTALRAELWPEDTADDHRTEVAEALASEKDIVAYVAEATDGRLAGFVEAALRHDYVNGCETSPVGFVEGLYVRPEFRGAQVGRALCEAVVDWARRRGCSELASDALSDNLESHAFHQAVGFEETERVVYFRKAL
ncbi:aminoglycoside 6'-N-acetyltransferase [Caulobacter segnis]|uniref:Aminoglycoside N(6')-acetyltransferase type 1 n=1 Tax=Caulobacter segnis TaxID=88688 RepID=A0A2W5XBM3_9CAUL|nr:aminoglycoside 6'-N-acetyltransferase [Caulobacter segnis]PZR34671.1 MAG: N-acetyltransferase [Caulobacter segnis]